jgi:hypothetical protein
MNKEIKQIVASQIKRFEDEGFEFDEFQRQRFYTLSYAILSSGPERQTKRTDGEHTMNKDNAKDYLPLVQALADGKTIQCKNMDGDWIDVSNFHFSGPHYDYRVKPEPREFLIAVNRHGCVFHSKQDMSSNELKEAYNDVEVIKVREVIE